MSIHIGNSMTLSTPSRVRRWLGAATLTGTLLAGGCDSVLEVTDPDILTEASSPAGAISLRNGVFLRMTQAFSAGGDAPDGWFLLSGLMADEWQSGDTFQQRNSTDQRVVAETNSFVINLSRRAHRVRTEARAAISALREYAPTPASNIGLMFAMTSFAENQLGEVFCNGIPFSELDGTNIVFGTPVSYDSAFRRAVSHADSALTNNGGTDAARITNFAAVLKARALLNLNQPAAAATAVASVPIGFVYQLTHSQNTAVNANWQQNINLRRYVMGNGEGGNGIAYRSANDPRIPPAPAGLPPLAFDGVVPTVAQGLWNDRASPITIASGIEARLIEAEAALRADNTTLFLSKLNDARATVAGLAPLTDPGSEAERVNLLFRERAFWLFGTGHRLGDLRRLVRQYGRNAETVFPTGTWFKGGAYGSDVNFPTPFDETNNPEFSGCTNRNA